ncbi:Ig domain-containing protein [Arenimonas alkanexedens]
MFAGLFAALALSVAGSAVAVDQPSTYPGCAARSVSVPWGGSVKIDLSDCHSFGLGAVSRPPAHGSATPGINVPIDSYRYTHGGASPAGGGQDRFVVLDDNSDTITISVSIAPGASAITIAPDTLPAMQAGAPVLLALAASGGKAPYRYRLAGGTLPPGLALAADGTLSGTPTAREAYGFELAVADAGGDTVRRSFAGSVTAAPLAIAPATTSAIQGQAFSLTLKARGGLAPYRFRIEAAPGLPEGLQLSSTGIISGTPTAAPGRYVLSLRVTDASAGPGAYFELKTFTLRIIAPPAP